MRLNSTAYTEAYKRCKNQVIIKQIWNNAKIVKIAGDLLIIYSTGKRLQQQSTRSQLMDKQLLVTII